MRWAVASTSTACRDTINAIAVATGAAIYGAAVAALRTRYMNVLVTDEGTASFLLDEPHE